MRPPQPSSGAKPVLPRLTWLTAFTYSIGVVSQSGSPSDLPRKASDFGIFFFIDSNGELDNLDPDDYIFACLSVIPRGFTWSLHWCHSVVVVVMVRAAIDTFSRVPRLWRVSFWTDSHCHSCPQDIRCSPLTSITQTLSTTLNRLFDTMGLPYRVEADGVGVHDTLGLAVDAERRFIVNKAIGCGEFEAHCSLSQTQVTRTATQCA